jgi:putative hydrolase of the HAD superfamily
MLTGIARCQDAPIVPRAPHLGSRTDIRASLTQATRAYPDEVSHESAKVILWDFDGTLAGRAGGTSFGACMVETLNEYEPDHGIDIALIRPFMRSGFPWHAPDRVHPHLSTAASWWEHVEPLLVRGFEGVGFASARARTLGRLARERYVDVRHWEVVDEAISALSTLRDLGWRHVILSNHVPELPAIVSGLGLASFFEAAINSAETGYEKPHPEAFAIARRAAGDPSTLWMVGDNPIADIAGAEAVGIPAILVRVEPSPERPVKYHASTLSEVVQIVARAQR